MKNQFYYTRKEPISPKEGETETMFKEFRDSFNVEKILRTWETDDGRILVILHDIHERLQEIPMFNKKGEKTGMKKERITLQSEIYLSKEDGERLYNMSNIQ
jgi:hypothetical protein